MTKSIRVENADMSSFKVVVEVWDKSTIVGEPDKLVETKQLTYPTALAEVSITSTRYLMVREEP